MLKKFIVTFLLLVMTSIVLSAPLANLTVTEFTQVLSEPNAKIDGAATAALTAILAASLAEKIAGLNYKHHISGVDWLQLEKKLNANQQTLIVLMQQDVDQFQLYLKMRKDSNVSQSDLAAMQEKMVATPLDMMLKMAAIIQIAQVELTQSDREFLSDAQTVVNLSEAALKSIGAIAVDDLSAIKNKKRRACYQDKINHLM